ncbi:MAG: hypothetical protein ABIP12_04500, partial [Terriglobales bacterium]
LQTLFLVVVGFLIASPYWVFWLYLRRQDRIDVQDKETLEEVGFSDAAVEQAQRWHNNRLVLIFVFISFAFIALKAFSLSKDSLWFHFLNVYYIWMILAFAHKALSKKEYESERNLSPNLDRKTWMLRWIPFYVLLPLMGWFANSLPILRGQL